MNPILRKDLLALLRLPRVAAMHVAFIAGLTLLVLATWPQQGVRVLASQGRDDLLLGLILGQVVFLALFVPGIAAVSLAGEKEANTFEMLYTSRLSAMQLIFGKVASALALPAMLLMSGLPFVALLNCRGDVDLPHLFSAYAVLIVAAITLAVASLTISCLCKESATALVSAYAFVLLTCGVSLLPAAIMLQTQEGIVAAVLHYVRSVSPVAAALSLLRPQPGDFAGSIHGLAPAWQIYLGVSAAMLVICISVLVLRLRRPPISEHAAPAPPAKRSLARRLLFIIDRPARRRPVGSLNPLLAVNRRVGQLRNAKSLVRVFYGTLLVALCTAAMSLYGGSEHADVLAYVAQALVVFQIGVPALIAPSLTSASISSEVESGTLELLRLTPLSSGQIFWGKLLPALPPAALPVLALIPAYAAICALNSVYLLTVAPLLPVLLLAIVFCCAVGLACSCALENSARATVAAYLVVVAMFVLPMLAWWGSGSLLNERPARWIWLCSPVAVSLQILPESGGDVSSPWRMHLMIVGGLSAMLLSWTWLRLRWLLRRN